MVAPNCNLAPDVDARLCSICPELATFVATNRSARGHTKLFPSRETGTAGRIGYRNGQADWDSSGGAETHQWRHSRDKNGVPELRHAV
jgi:hypothetical protein